MPLYRARLQEVQGVDLGDGRHVILAESPSYMPSATFLERFEVVPERRAVERRKTNGRKPTRSKGRERRSAQNGKAGRRTAPTVADGIKAVVAGKPVPRGGAKPARIEAKRLFAEEGLDVKAITAKLKLPYSTVYGWSKKDHWQRRRQPVATTAATGTPTPAAAVPPAATRPRTPARESDIPGDGGWMA